ncbi:MAG: inorganic phosphate transporter [Deltaproteobacteria bacterium]|nr:inorganic phosphate transporter [Deltaproteobacteria bacterium]MBW2447956.1 inorganic phosphate transporter [Deltaproteobacteria bacterium]
MAWAIGANDVANAMGTSVGSGALTLMGAIVVAGTLEFAGAFLAGGHVTDTIRKGILDTSALQRDELIWGMLASLAAAGTWLIFASRMGWPVSTTHSIVGAIVGFGAVAIGPHAVQWAKVGQIVASWVTSPVISGTLAFLVFILVRRTVLDHPDPMVRAKRIGPFFFFWVFFTIGLVTLFKGLKNLKLDLDLPDALLYSAVLGLAGAVFGWFLLGRIGAQAPDPKHRFSNVERVFAVLQILTACAVAFAHGSNDVANAIGPLAAAVNAAQGGDIGGKAPVELWMLGIGGVGIVIGLATYGYKVMATIGKQITELTPSRGFAAELAAATTIVIASQAGIPVSTTHTLVGAVLGVGLARGIGALDLRVVGKIAVSWVVTLPTGAVLSIFFYFFFKGVFSP